MRGITRKLLLSISIMILLFGTIFATTYAWVGLFTYGVFEQFKINLEASDAMEYGIEISLTGKPGTFGPSVSSTEVKKMILLNMGYTEEQLSSDNQINENFKRINLAQCSSDLNGYEFSGFYDIDGRQTKQYFQFDLYISAYKVDGTTDESNYFTDVYLCGDILSGRLDSSRLINKISYPSDYYYPLLKDETINNATTGKEFSGLVKTNSSFATRLAIQNYSIVDKYDFEQKSTVTDMKIYHIGSEVPTYYFDSNSYSFGGILPTNQNFAHMAYNSTLNSWYRHDVPDWAVNRGDILFKEDGKTNRIIDSSILEQRVGINTMMKLTIYFWFEGWDADCFAAIDSNPVDINLNFAISDKKF